MQKKFWLFVVLAGMLVGCTAVDDSARIAVNYGDDIIAKFGDDIINNADTLIGTTILQSQDEGARTTITSIEKILQTRTASEEIYDLATIIAQSTDNLPRSSLLGFVDDPAPIVLYQNANRISPLQDEFIAYLASENTLNRDEAELMLQTICWITDYVNLMGEYPSTDYGLFYVNIHFAVNQIQPDVLEAKEFTQEAFSFAARWLNDPNLNADTIQESAQILTSGLCMIEP